MAYTHLAQSGNVMDVYKHIMLLEFVDALFIDKLLRMAKGSSFIDSLTPMEYILQHEAYLTGDDKVPVNNRTSFVYAETHCARPSYSTKKQAFGWLEEMHKRKESSSLAYLQNTPLSRNYKSSWMQVLNRLTTWRLRYRYAIERGMYLNDIDPSVAYLAKAELDAEPGLQYKAVESMDADSFYTKCVVAGQPMDLVFTDPVYDSTINNKSSNSDWQKARTRAKQYAKNNQPALIWYPIYTLAKGSPVDLLVNDLQNEGIPTMQMYQAGVAESHRTMKGSGMLIVGIPVQVRQYVEYRLQTHNKDWEFVGNQPVLVTRNKAPFVAKKVQK